MYLKFVAIQTVLSFSLTASDRSYQQYSTDDRRNQTNKSGVVVIETELGGVAGLRKGPVNSFLGIPFAQPPINSLRFRPPVRKRPWYPQIIEAFKFGPECLQSSATGGGGEDDIKIQSEDCLFINVWQPAAARSDSQLPVLLWIYGGAFLHGSTARPEYIGDILAAKDVVVVSCNYRLGALGFLVSTVDGLYGNYGLDDQKMAMQWVQDHISNFGGDPDRVTLFGESAGAMSIGLHLLDQHENNQNSRYSSKGFSFKPSKPRMLFHAVILQSNPFGYKYRSLAVSNFIGAGYKELLDCEDLGCLQSESADELIHVQDTLLLPFPRSIGNLFSWGPVATDSYYHRETRFAHGPLSNITVRQPMEHIKALRKMSVNIPVIIGTNEHEGNVFVYSAFTSRMSKLVYQACVFGFFQTSAPSVLKKYAPLTRRIDESPYPDYRLVLSEIIGDYLFRCPNRLFANRLSFVKNPVFLYEFSLPTKTPGFPCCDGISCHTCELPYVFGQINVIKKSYCWTGLDLNKNENPDSNNNSSQPQLQLEVELQSDQCLSENFQRKKTQEQLEKEKAAKGATKRNGGGGGGEVIKESLTGGLFKGLPDIIGAATSWLSGTRPEEVQLNARMAVDQRVARLMSDYWSTFAKYGDPNGSPIQNGYREGTRPADAPWWPRLRGELYSMQAIEEMQAAAAKRSVFLSRGVGDLKEGEEEGEEEEEEDIDVAHSLGRKSGGWGSSSKRSRGNGVEREGNHRFHLEFEERQIDMDRDRERENSRSDRRDGSGSGSDERRRTDDRYSRRSAQDDKDSDRNRNRYQSGDRERERERVGRSNNHDSDSDSDTSRPQVEEVDDDDDDYDEKDSQWLFTFPLLKDRRKRGSDARRDRERERDRDWGGERGRGSRDRGRDDRRRDREEERSRSYAEEGPSNRRFFSWGDTHTQTDSAVNSSSANDDIQSSKYTESASEGEDHPSATLDSRRTSRTLDRQILPLPVPLPLPLPRDAGRYMHLLRFDESSDVDIIKSNCMCAFWDALDYRF